MYMFLCGRLSVAVYGPDATIVYYSITSGLVPPEPPEKLEEKRQKRQQQFDERKKQWISATEAKTLQKEFDQGHLKSVGTGKDHALQQAGVLENT